MKRTTVAGAAANKGFDAADGYLDAYPSATKKPNDEPYGKGAAYTGKEHARDEAFGRFGAPAHVLALTPKQAYDIAERTDLAAADPNGDGKVDLDSEMAFGPACYAAGEMKALGEALGGKTSAEND